jgi:hypothetical protein
MAHCANENNSFHCFVPDLSQFFEKIPVFRDTLLDESDDPLFVDEVCYSAFVIKLPYRIAFVRDQREIEFILFSELLVSLKAVGAYRQYLCIELFKLFQILLECLHLAGSDRRKVGKVKGEHHILIPEIISEADRPLC